MRFTIILQILIARISICASENVSTKDVFLHNQHKQVAIQKLNGSYITNSNELYDGFKEGESEENDLDFEYNYDDSNVKESDVEQEMQEILLKAMRKPTIRKQIGEVVPILRAMSPAQRFTLAALVSSQIMTQKPLSENKLTEVASMFAGKKIENADDRHNITEQLLLPISMDIAQIFKGLGKEVGRNLRHNFYTVQNNESKKSNFRRRFTRKPITSAPSIANNRRMDETDYDDFDDFEEGESLEKPVAEALRRPGKEECDYFTKSLCLEVSNYPTEAIISSLKKNADIAKTFLTDFYQIENDQNKKPEPNGRRLERREDSKNDIQDQLHPEEGYMCPSFVKYARPKRARTTSGHWKYVVNAGDYTQTLRLEICSKPKSPCSFVTNHLRSECSQVYNYHRLLTWDEIKGLHMDVFKVPSCCSCHIQGYLNFYPPSGASFAQKRKEATEYSPTLNQELSQFNYAGNKRDVPVPIILENQQHVSIKPPQVHENPDLPIQQPHNLLNLPSSHHYVKDPVDHLIPPGPLLLENEGNYKNPTEPKFYSETIRLEQTRRFPSAEDNVRPVKEATERIIIHDLPRKPFIQTSLPKSNIPSPVPSVSQGLFTTQIHLPLPPSHIPLESNQNFESGSQTRHLGLSVNPSSQLSILDSQNTKPGKGNLFFTNLSTSKRVNSNGIKPKPSQYFIPDGEDLKSIPSKVRPSFVAKPKLEPEIVTATTPLPKKLETISLSGQKKINYNYHPIIDFFTPEFKRSQPKFSSHPHYLPLASQGWTPMVRP